MVLRSKPGLVRQQGETKGGECESKGVNLLQPKQACEHKKGARKSQRRRGQVKQPVSRGLKNLRLQECRGTPKRGNSVGGEPFCYFPYCRTGLVWLSSSGWSIACMSSSREIKVPSSYIYFQSHHHLTQSLARKTPNPSLEQGQGQPDLPRQRSGCNKECQRNTRTLNPKSKQKGRSQPAGL